MTDGLESPMGRRYLDTEHSTAQTLVSAARRHLGMDRAFVAEIGGGRRTFRFVDAVAGAVRLEVGHSHELADTYCHGIINGTIPEVIPDSSIEPSVRGMAVTGNLGIASYIGVPVRYSDGRLFGTLCCLAHTKHGELGEEQRRYLSVMAETVAAELEQTAQESRGREESRERIERTIDEQLFSPVYQPIVELSTGRIVGAEALTRFTADDRGPLAWFAEAAIIGLGTELELAAVTAALSTFESSPDIYLSLNLSPSALGGFLDVIRRGGFDPRCLVVELTEHTQVLDYAVVLRSMRKLRDLAVRVAVDDTGAGVSSLRHISRDRSGHHQARPDSDYWHRQGSGEAGPRARACSIRCQDRCCRGRRRDRDTSAASGHIRSRHPPRAGTLPGMPPASSAPDYSSSRRRSAMRW